MTTTTMSRGKTDWIDDRVHDYCRDKMSAYWFGYFLPEERCRMWMLFCYCFRALDTLTDKLTPHKATREIDKVYASAMSTERTVFRSDYEKYCRALVDASKHDKKVTSYLLRGYSAQRADVARGNFVDANKLERIRRGKSADMMKLWIYLADPTLPGTTIEKIGKKLGLCGQYLDDLLDLEEDFAMGKSTITKEQAKKYGIRTADDVYESGLANDLFKRASKMHVGALVEIRKIRNPLTRLFLLTFAVRFDPRDVKFGKSGRVEEGRTNVLKRILNLLKGVSPRSYLPGHAFAYLVGLPILLVVLVVKGYLRYMLG